MNPRALLALLAAAVPALHAAAADYPERPIKIIVPFAAGSGTDQVARATGAALSKRLGQPVTVENMNGANGATGTAAVAKAAPDGYTLLFTSNPFTIAPHLAKAPSFNPVKDFVPVVRVAVIPLVVVTSAKSRFRTFDDLLAELRQNPGKVRYATSGRGTFSHLEVASQLQHFKLQAQDRPYKSAQQALAATAGGEAEFFAATLPSAIASINKGALRPLAVSSQARIPRMADVPTLAEVMKRPNYESEVWYGMVAPVGTTSQVITRLENETERELAVESVNARIEAVGGQVGFLRSAPFGGLIGYEYRKWGQALKGVSGQ